MAFPLKHLIDPSWCQPEGISITILNFASRRQQQWRAQHLPHGAELLASWSLAAGPHVTKPSLLPLLKEAPQPWPMPLLESGPPVLATVGFGWLCVTPSMPSAALGFIKCPYFLQQLGWNQTHFIQFSQLLVRSDLGSLRLVTWRWKTPWTVTEWICNCTGCGTLPKQQLPNLFIFALS